jgi:hypothetical protein
MRNLVMMIQVEMIPIIQMMIKNQQKINNNQKLKKI